MTDPTMPTIGEVVADKYEIAKLIGEGGMGSVFMATHKLTGKEVALKWMLPELAKNEDAVQRFLREAQAAGRINHPNVVDIYDVGQHESSYFLVMEYLRGETLTEALEREQLDPGAVVDIIVPCLRGVAAAHKRGVVHRDIKPDNIFLCRSDEGAYLYPKVLDFGISKLSGADSQMNPRLTRTGAVMGTPYYMSPEQVRGSSEVDGRCDVYAFGVILYEALTGQVPFNAETYSALVLEIATGTPRDPRELKPDLPDELAEAVLKAMAREPDDRYPDIRAFAESIVPFADNARYTMDRATFERPDPTGNFGRMTATPYTSEQLVVPGRRKSGLAIVLGSAVAAAAALILGFVLLKGDDPSGAGPATGVQPGADGTHDGSNDGSAAVPGAPGEGLPLGVEVPEGLVGADAGAQTAEATAGEGNGETPDETTDDATAAGTVDGTGDGDGAAVADDVPEAATAKKPKPRRRWVKPRSKPDTSKPVVAVPEPSKPTTTPKPRPGRTGSLSVDDF